MHDPEGVRNVGVVVRVAWGAVIVQVEGEPDAAGVLEHEVAELVVIAGTARSVDGDRDGAVAVVGDGVVVAVGDEDVGEGAAGGGVDGDPGSGQVLPEVREG